MPFALLTTESTGNSTLKRSQMNTERRTNFDLLLKMQYCEGPVSQFRGYDVTNKFCIVLNGFAIHNSLQGNNMKADGIKGSLRKESTNTKVITNK